MAEKRWRDVRGEMRRARSGISSRCVLNRGRREDALGRRERVIGGLPQPQSSRGGKPHSHVPPGFH